VFDNELKCSNSPNVASFIDSKSLAIIGVSKINALFNSNGKVAYIFGKISPMLCL
jgi:hypothetical protein